MVTTAQVLVAFGTCTTIMEDLSTLDWPPAAFGWELYTVWNGCAVAGSGMPVKIWTCCQEQQQQ